MVQTEQRMLAGRKLKLMQTGYTAILISLLLVLLCLVLALLSIDKALLNMSYGGSMFLMFLVLMGSLASLVGVVLHLVGLYGLRPIRKEYCTAFLCLVIALVLSPLSELTAEGSAAFRLLYLGRTVLNLIAIWFTLQGTNGLMEAVGRGDVSARGQLVWILSWTETVLTILMEMLPLGAVLENMGLGLVLLLSLLYSLASLVFYWNYLKRASDALLAASEL